MKASSWASALVVVMFFGLMLLKLRQPDPWVGKPAPDFTLAVAHGEGAAQGDRVRLSDLKGQLVVLDFWASWCEPCRQSVPILNQVARTLAAEGVRVYGVNAEGFKPETLARVAARWQFAYPVLTDPTAQTQLAYDVEALPTLYLIDKQGIVQKTHAGSPSAERLIEEVRELAR
jgi:cytochrome c biogenesis protein CcmG, thiol:disulfide interchange protein DsbE